MSKQEVAVFAKDLFKIIPELLDRIKSKAFPAREIQKYFLKILRLGFCYLFKDIENKRFVTYKT